MPQSYSFFLNPTTSKLLYFLKKTSLLLHQVHYFNYICIKLQNHEHQNFYYFSQCAALAQTWQIPLASRKQKPLRSIS